MTQRLAFVILAFALTACSLARTEHLHGTAVDLPAPAFTLTSDRDQRWSLEDQRGKGVVLYFGFTHCADTCPLTLAKLSRAIASLGAQAGNAEIAFVTVDPERDTPVVLARYLRRFHGATLVGLTGTPAQVARVEHAYGIWAQKIPGKHQRGGYDVSHSDTILLVDASGRERELLDADANVTAIASDLRTIF